MRWLAASLMAVYLAFFFALTLGGFYQPVATINLVPFETIRHDFRNGGPEFVVNFLGNLAAGFRWASCFQRAGRRCSWAKVAGSGLAVSLLIEILQGISGHRVADVDDVFLNTAGGLLGYGVWRTIGRLWGGMESASWQGVTIRREVADSPRSSKNGEIAGGT